MRSIPRILLPLISNLLKYFRTIFTKSPARASSVIYGIVLEDFSVTLYYTPEGSNSTENIKVTPLASQYPADPEAWHFICVMVVDMELSYFLDGEYVGTDVMLKNTIADSAGRARVGQMYSGIIDIYFSISLFSCNILKYSYLKSLKSNLCVIYACKNFVK